MVAKLIFLVGLCGSGKSYLWKTHFKSSGAELIEGIKHQEDTMGENITWEPIFEKLRNGKTCVIDDTTLCLRAYQEHCLKMIERLQDIEKEWIFFENNVNKANANLDRHERQNDGRNVPTMKHRNQELSANYYIPDGYEIREIWQGE